MSPYDRVRSESGWCSNEDNRRYENRITGETISYFQIQDDIFGRSLLDADPELCHDSIERAMRRGPDSE